MHRTVAGERLEPTTANAVRYDGPPVDRIYLDLCCLKRPFDDQRQERIRRETEAVAYLIEQAERGAVTTVRSPALVVENDANPREDRRLATALWIHGAHVEVGHTEQVARRARELHALGFGVLDGLHVAFAEAAGARFLVTCDDGLSSLASRHAALLRLAVINPCDYEKQSRS
jgi:predicted nucleic acid-binding protein